jgi:hypothetical protein
MRLIEFLSGEIADITDMQNDSRKMPLQTSGRSRNSKNERSDRICQATKIGGTESNWRKCERGGRQYRSRKTGGSEDRSKTGKAR